MRASIAVGVLIVFACSTPQQVIVFPFVDAALPRAELGQPGWDYARLLGADLDGDGSEERIVLLANAVMRRGEPVWDDSQIWQVYVEEPDGERTYVFSRSIQLGRLEMRMTTGGQRSRVLLIEDTPHVLSVYEITYRGPQDFTTTILTQRQLDPSAGRPR